MTGISGLTKSPTITKNLSNLSFHPGAKNGGPNQRVLKTIASTGEWLKAWDSFSLDDNSRDRRIQRKSSTFSHLHRDFSPHHKKKEEIVNEEERTPDNNKRKRSVSFDEKELVKVRVFARDEETDSIEGVEFSEEVEVENAQNET